MNIDWIDSTHPRGVVGIAPDGGFYVHATLHPLGIQGAIDRSKQAGVVGEERSSELYFPMPWIRSELAWVLKRIPNLGQSALENRASVTLNETLPTLLKLERRCNSVHAN